MRISDWSSDVCSSDLLIDFGFGAAFLFRLSNIGRIHASKADGIDSMLRHEVPCASGSGPSSGITSTPSHGKIVKCGWPSNSIVAASCDGARTTRKTVSSLTPRSEEHTSELQSLMRISYAVFCLKKKKHTKT